MLYPTMTATILGLAFLTALAAVDWFVWSGAGPASFDHPNTARPLTLRELTNRFLGRVVALNAEVLPVEVSGNHHEAQPSVGNDGHGFKKVA